MSRPGSSSRCVELNHTPPLVRAPPSVPLVSMPCYSPIWGTYCVNSGTEGVDTSTLVHHRLQPGLSGYLIPFAPQAFARLISFVESPSPLVFFLISTHFTTTLEFTFLCDTRWRFHPITGSWPRTLTRRPPARALRPIPDDACRPLPRLLA